MALVHAFRKPAPLGTHVSFTFEPNHTHHHDLVLRIDTWAHRGDSYYFALDHAEKGTVGSLRAMLKQWRSMLNAISVGEFAYLPHDFSDQCTGWMRCLRTNRDEIEIVAGWSAIEGWSFAPSRCHEMAKTVADFRPIATCHPLTLLRDKLLADIERSYAAL